MSKIKNGGLGQYGAKHFEQQQFGTAGGEGVKVAAAVSLQDGRPALNTQQTVLDHRQPNTTR